VNRQRFDAIAWDIDGTLVDSEPLHHRALLAGSAGFGVDLSDVSDEAYRGVHMNDVWRILHARWPSDLDERDWIGAINNWYVSHRAELVAIAGARETVASLARRGVPQVCVSNSSRSVVDANLKALGLEGIVAFSISLDDVTAGKPDPEPYAYAAKRLAVAPQRIVAIEDSPSGVRSARAAGLFVVGFSPTRSTLVDCDLVVDRLSDILALFEGGLANR
jgi:HAD superfamily hydrolase (TIGR01509 family)